MSAVQVKRSIKMESDFEIVKFQIITHCFISKITLNETELNILALLGCLGEITLADFCVAAADAGYLGGETAVNNCLRRIEKTNLFIKKKGQGRKVIFLNPNINVEAKGSIVLNYTVFKV